VGVGSGLGESLRVDPERLAQLGLQMVDAATGLPTAPAPFTETGTDPLSAAIRDKLPDIEDPIREALPKLKAEATKTANNIVTAAGHYQRTDEQLAADYDEHRFDGVVGSGAGSAGSGGGGADPGQLMGLPLQMASQAAQVPMQAMGAAASVPQAAMQGVQQFAQMGGGTGVSGPGTSPSGASGPGIGPLQDRQDEKDEKDRQDEKDDRQHGAASGDPNGGRAPVSPTTEVVVPQQNLGRHAAPDPSINL
jgi:Excreted virulence factor EspC, type VII ESX diderm